MGLLFKVSISSTACTFYAFFCSTLITFGFNIMLPRQPKVEHIVICVILVKTLHVIVGFFVKRSFVCESKFSWWLFQLVVVSRFCLKTLPLNTSLSGSGDKCLRKVEFLILVDSKISICIWWRFVRVRTFEITEWIVCSVLLESTVINFDVNREL